MIDSDVRVSNIVGMPKEWATVDQIGDECTVLLQDGEYAHIPWTAIEPLPITEEWLVKFGFTQTGSSQYNHTLLHFEKDNDGSVIQIDFRPEHDGMVWVSISDVDYEGCIVTPIRFTNQLQNLYHALTGKELWNDPKFTQSRCA